MLFDWVSISNSIIASVIIGAIGFILRKRIYRKVKHLWHILLNPSIELEADIVFQFSMDPGDFSKEVMSRIARQRNLKITFVKPTAMKYYSAQAKTYVYVQKQNDSVFFDDSEIIDNPWTIYFETDKKIYDNYRNANKLGAFIEEAVFIVEEYTKVEPKTIAINVTLFRHDKKEKTLHVVEKKQANQILHRMYV